MADVAINGEVRRPVSPQITVIGKAEVGESSGDTALGGGADLSLSLFDLREAGDFGLNHKFIFSGLFIDRPATPSASGGMEECEDGVAGPSCPDTNVALPVSETDEGRDAAVDLRAGIATELAVALYSADVAIVTLGVSPELFLDFRRDNGASDYEQGLILALSGEVACRASNGMILSAGARVDVFGTNDLVTQANRMLIMSIGAGYEF